VAIVHRKVEKLHELGDGTVLVTANDGTLWILVTCYTSAPPQYEWERIPELPQGEDYGTASMDP